MTPRRIWLCADDYGIAPGVNEAIRRLIAQGRLNATSVMVNAPSCTPAEAGALAALNAGEKRAAIGLHVTLTGNFVPVSDGYRPLRSNHFPSVGELGRLAHLRRLSAERLTAEIGSQLRLFVEAFGRTPDFLDGHQHVHLFPQVRDAFLKVAHESAPSAWVRQCGRPARARSVRDSKALLLDIMSVRFRAKAARLGVRTNPAFSGSYDFVAGADYSAIFPRFLAGQPDGGLIMCHPGFVDDALRNLDPLTDLREREFAFLASDAFPQVLADNGVVLARPGENTWAA